MSRHRVLNFVVFFAAGLVTTVAARDGAVALRGDDARIVSRRQIDAAEIFKRNCSACHGKKGKGDGPAAVALNPRPANLANAKFMAQYSDEELREIITNGRRTMPAFGKLLKPEELQAVAEFVRSLSANE
ncbi:MAG: c-type cytochrome [Gemmatimonadales bacterium]